MSRSIDFSFYVMGVRQIMFMGIMPMCPQETGHKGRLVGVQILTMYRRRWPLMVIMYASVAGKRSSGKSIFQAIGTMRIGMCQFPSGLYGKPEGGRLVEGFLQCLRLVYES